MTTSYATVADRARELDDGQTLASGRLCLEFADTLYWRESDAPVETLSSYADLVNWSLETGIIDAAAAESLLVTASQHPILTQQSLEWARDLREAIYRIFVAIAYGGGPAPADVRLLNEALTNAMTGPELVQVGPDAWRLQWRGDRSGLDRMLWPVLRSAIHLLTEDDLSRLGQCADDRGCGYLFYDTTRNRSRRWCDMNTCGNRAKARRHHARHKHADAQQT